MNTEKSNEPNVSKTLGNKRLKPVILASTGQVKPLSMIPKKKLPRYKVFLKNIRDSETSESGENLLETDEKTEKFNPMRENTPLAVRHVKYTAQSLAKAAEKLCFKKDLKGPRKSRDLSAPSTGLDKLTDTWRFSENYALDRKDLDEAESSWRQKLDSLRTEEPAETQTLHQKILMEMMAPINVTKEDILNLKEAFVKVVPKTAEKEKPVERQLPGVLEKMEEEISKTTKIKPIYKVDHHVFCEERHLLLPRTFRKTSWKYHTPSKFHTHFPIKDCRESIAKSSEPTEEGKTKLTARLMMECEFKNELDELKATAEQLLSELQMTIEGNEVPTMANDDMYFWSLSPPKFNITPKHVKNLIFPLYNQSPALDILRYRKMDKKHRFMPTFAIMPQGEDMDSFHYKKDSIEIESSLSKESWSNIITQTHTPTQSVSDKSIIVEAPYTAGETKDISQMTLATQPSFKEMSSEGYQPASEVQSQRQLISYRSIQVTSPSKASSIDEELLDKPSVKEESSEDHHPQSESRHYIRSHRSQRQHQFSLPEVTIHDIKNMICTPKASSFHSLYNFGTGTTLQRSTSSDPIMTWKQKQLKRSPILDIDQYVSPKLLTASLSVENISDTEKESKFKPRAYQSDPNYYDLERLATHKGKPSDMKLDDWIVEVWRIWYNEKPSDIVPESQNIRQIYESIGLSSLLSPSFSSKPPADISFKDFLNLSTNFEFVADIQIITEEVNYLCKRILTEALTPDPEIIYKRALLYLKIGDYTTALEEFNKVIALDPNHTNAYWHRHIIHINQGNFLDALNDLKFLQEQNGSYEIYMALGLLYAKLEEPQMAIYCFTKATQYNPTEDLPYTYRAQLYEMGGRVEEAIVDYKNIIDIKPANTSFIKRHAALCMKVRKWKMARADYKRLLDLSYSPKYLLDHAKVSIELKDFTTALEDLCKAIHLDPNFAEAYFLRGYLLKKSNQKKALSDFSISLHLNDKPENLRCYYQRGLLYMKLGLVYEAICDFLTITTFQPGHKNSLLCLGLLYSYFTDNFKKGIMYFTKLINLEPTCTRGYFYRAQTYMKIENYTSALRDLIILLHMYPNNYRNFMYLGYVCFKLGFQEWSNGFLSLAGENCSETGIALSSEMAMVQLYLGNINNALSILKYNLTKDPCSIPLLEMLAKVQIADFRYREALQTYFLIKDIINPAKKEWPEEAADVFFHIGLVHIRLEEYAEALAAFNQAIRINKTHKEAYYFRGYVKMQLNMCNLIRDFNRSLVANRENAKVYLSRACHFGALKNYPKAILNCNEALKIEPKSIKAFLYRGALKYFVAAYKFAIADLTEAININANIAVLYLNRGICYAASKRISKAIRDYSIALLIGGQMDYKAYVNRGLLYYNKNDIPNAYHDFRCAIKIFGGDHRVYHILGLITHKMEKPDVAVKVLTRSMILQPNFQEAFISRANVYMDYLTDKENQLAKRDYLRAIMIKPTNCLAYVSLGIYFQVEQKYQMAWHQFTNALLIDPSYQPAYEARAILSLQMGHKYPAFHDLTFALSIAPTAELYNNRGVVNQMMGSPAAALHDYYKAIKVNQSFALAYYNAGSLHLQGRFFKQALNYLNRAIVLDRHNECAYINRAITKAMLNDVKGAFQDFATAIERCPYYTHVFYNRGSLHASLQNHKMAEEDFTTALHIYPSDVPTILRRAEARRQLGKYDLALADYKYAILLMDNPNRPNSTESE